MLLHPLTSNLGGKKGECGGLMGEGGLVWCGNEGGVGGGGRVGGGGGLAKKLQNLLCYFAIFSV